jgi:integrase
MAGKLNAAQVRAQRTPGKYLDGHGLSLRVVTPTRRVWEFRYQRHGRERLMSLGNADIVTLAQAREAHTQARALLAQGIDPLDQRREQQAPAPSQHFGAIAEAYISAHEAGWRNAKHRQQWRNTLATYAKPIAAKPVNEIGVNDVLAVLKPIWNAKPETASRVRGRIELILDYARARGLRHGENPALWRGNLKLMLPAKSKLRVVEHHAALDWREAPDFIRHLMTQEQMSARALLFAILTAARSGEVREAPWDEIDLDNAVWTIPASRMKATRPHRVPLSEPALDILRGLAQVRTGPLIFFGRKFGVPLTHKTLPGVLRSMGRGDLTAHGFRSTFRDWVADNGKPADLAEAALAHVNGDKTMAAYQRSDLFERRRALMVEWATFLTTPAIRLAA